MQLDSYYEDLSFAEGRKIIVSKNIDADYVNSIHWHPYAEILLSLQDGNTVTINFNKYDLKPNDLVIVYPGDLHSVENVSEESFLIIQFPINLITVMNDINRILPVLYKTLYCSYDPCNVENDRMILTLKQIDVLRKSEHPFVEVDTYSLLLTFFSLFGQYCINSNNAHNSGYTVTQYKSSRLMAEYYPPWEPPVSRLRAIRNGYFPPSEPPQHIVLPCIFDFIMDLLIVISGELQMQYHQIIYKEVFLCLRRQKSEAFSNFWEKI